MDIPKVIHYCWFGRAPLPESVLSCIRSWKKYMPEYEIREWNEDNFDTGVLPYTKEAYEAGKYAFVSDYARFYILYKYGGVYFDTDVELIKSIVPVLKDGPYMGCERDGGGRKGIAVSPGLGMAAPAGFEIYKDFLKMYEGIHFIIDGRRDCTTIVDRTTEVLRKKGLKDICGIQRVAGIAIYPKEYFCPKEIDADVINITENTYSVHHYDASWAEPLDKQSGRRAYKLKKIFGERAGAFINAVIYAVQKYGFFGAARQALKKMREM